MTATGSKWRLTSIMKPRQRKRGASSMVTAGTCAAVVFNLHQLQECFHAVHGADVGGRVQRGLRGRDL